MNNTQPPELVMPPCERAKDTIFSQLEAEPVSLADRRFLETHLETCNDCRAYQQSLSHLSDSVSDLEEVPVPIGLESRIMARIAAEAAPVKVPAAVGDMSRSPWRKYTPVAAAALILAVAIPLVLKGVSPDLSDSKLANSKLAAQTDKQAARQTVAMQSKISDELILEQTRQKPAQAQTQPAEEEPKVQPQQGGRDQKNRLSTTDAGVIAQTPKKKAISVPAQPVRQARPAKVMIAETSEVDGTQLAYAGTMNLQETYASESESDVYYDPVSTLVGF